MNYQLVYTDSYIKRARRFLKKHPELISQYEKALRILEINPQHPSLRLHQLKGRLNHLHSISINISYRITLEFYFADNKIILVNVSHHKNVY